MSKRCPVSGPSQVSGPLKNQFLGEVLKIAGEPPMPTRGGEIHETVEQVTVAALSLSRCSRALAHETSAVATEESPVRILDALPELDARTPAQLLKSANI